MRKVSAPGIGAVRPFLSKRSSRTKCSRKDSRADSHHGACAWWCHASLCGNAGPCLCRWPLWRGQGLRSAVAVRHHAPRGQEPTDLLLRTTWAADDVGDIHFPEGAQHKGPEFSEYAGTGDGHGHGTGFRISGPLSKDEPMPLVHPVAATEQGDLEPGDTIEIHFV